MAVADNSIDPRLLKSARSEFLAKGFEKASLKHICDNAGITTGAVYKRYAGKEELFTAIVADTISDMDNFASVRISVDPRGLSDQDLLSAWDMGRGGGSTLMEWFRFLDARKDDFILLIKGAAGTRYADFQHTWVEKMCDGTYNYYEELLRRGLAEETISIQEMHILMTAFWSTVYEPFIHGYEWAQIERHCEIVCRMFDWERVFKLHK